MNNQRTAGHTVDWSRSFLDDQMHQFLRLELQINPRALEHRNLVMSRCVSHLVALANCSQATAESAAAQAIAEIESAGCPLTVDISRSTSYALFVNDRGSGKTRVISAKDLQRSLHICGLIETSEHFHQLAGLDDHRHGVTLQAHNTAP